MAQSNIDLSNYVLVARYDLPEPTRTVAPANSLLAQEVSAVTYNWDTDSLFVVGDGSTSIVQVSKTGQFISSMTLAQGSSPQGTEFYDVEGLTYIGNGQFVMTEERDRQVVKFTYTADTVLTRANTQTVDLGTFVQNIGLEGLSYDPQTGGFIVVNEITPEAIFQTNIDFAAGTATNASSSTVNYTSLFDPALVGVSDFADVFALSNITSLNGQADSSHLLVLSQEAGKIVEVDRAGNIYSSLTITSNAGNPLTVPAQQHEGLTMDADGNLYVVSENGGGDFNHPQLWVYAPSTVLNQAPTAIALTNQVNAIDENTSTTLRVKVADVAITDDGIGTNNYSVTGADAAFFEVDSNGLYIKAGTVLDFETKTNYAVTVNVDDPSVGATPDASTSYNLNINNIVNENPAQPVLYVSEVAPWSSGNSPLGSDWFEITNSGGTAVNITGWKMDDNSNTFANAVALNGITSIGAGESVIFIECAPIDLAAKAATFLQTWFGGNAPAGLHIGSYSGPGVGLSTGGDAVNIYNASGVLQTNVSFGVSPSGPFPTFNNAAGLNNTLISTKSAVGINGAFIAVSDVNEVGSPGSVGRLIISEVAPWSSGNSPTALRADWFEVTNTTAFAVDITGWKMDDNSGSPIAAVPLNGITSIAPGQSVIFIETATPADLPAKAAAFLQTWFNGNPPANLVIGSYSGGGVGLSTGGDAVNLYNASNVLQASVSFGTSPTGTFATFDNAQGLNGTAISQLSSTGVNAAFVAAGDVNEIGSPGLITAVNAAPVAVDDALASIAEDSGARTISFASLLGNDRAGPANEIGQALTIIAVSDAAGGTVSIVGTDVIFTPTLNYNGPASFNYTVQDNGKSYGLNHFLSDVGAVVFNITAVNDAPVIAPASFTIAENSTAVGTVTATDVENDGFTFALAGGNDQAFFAINTNTGALSFIATPDFETPEDAGLNNVYDVIVAATDINGASSTQNISVTVTDEREVGKNTKGTIGIDTIDSGFGNDEIYGREGDDRLFGNDGDDGVYGGKGNDMLDGGRGNDLLDGGEGDDTLLGGLGDDQLIGGGGADTLDGGVGNDDVNGGNGDDMLKGNFGNDTLTGGNGDDTLMGNQGNDMLYGNLGNDKLEGGGGDDDIYGGGGNDTIVFGKFGGHDTVYSFDANPAGGQDLIDLTSLDLSSESFAEYVSITATEGGTLVSLLSGDTLFLKDIVTSTVTINDFLL